MRQIGKTGLTVTSVLYQQSQRGLVKPGRYEAVTLMAVTNRKTGAIGHLLHEIVECERDVEHEGFYTDNPSLFSDEHPEADEVTSLSMCGRIGTPAEPTQEVSALMLECHRHPLEYRAEHPDRDDFDGQLWGLFPA